MCPSFCQFFYSGLLPRGLRGDSLACVLLQHAPLTGAASPAKEASGEPPGGRGAFEYCGDEGSYSVAAVTPPPVGHRWCSSPFARREAETGS